MATEGAPSPECTIKENISRNGERIYHMENQRIYARIKMDKGGFSLADLKRFAVDLA